MKEPPLPADNANNDTDDDDNHIGGKGKNYNKNGGFVDYKQESKRKMTAFIMAEAGGDGDNVDSSVRGGEEYTNEGINNDNDDNDNVKEEEFDDSCIANNYTTQSAKLQRESWHKKVHTNYLTGMTTIMTIATRRLEECPLRKSN